MHFPLSSEDSFHCPSVTSTQFSLLRRDLIAIAIPPSKMKLIAHLLLALLPGVLSFPTAAGRLVAKRESLPQVTDRLLFNTTLPAFITHRDGTDPPSLDWTSDGCTDAPDNPFGFPFTDACYRHDFGYQNYRHQDRFTQGGKLRIDNNFRSDLDYLCRTTGHVGVCDALADVYYAAVRAFGGANASPGGRREADLVEEYEAKLAIYNQLVKEAQDRGELPTLG